MGEQSRAHDLFCDNDENFIIIKMIELSFYRTRCHAATVRHPREIFDSKGWELLMYAVRFDLVVPVYL